MYDDFPIPIGPLALGGGGATLAGGTALLTGHIVIAALAVLLIAVAGGLQLAKIRNASDD